MSYFSETYLEENLGPNWKPIIMVFGLLSLLLAYSIMTGGCSPDKNLISSIQTSPRGGMSLGDILLIFILFIVAYVSYIKYYKQETIKIGSYEF